MFNMIEMNYMMYKRDMIGMIWVLMYYINWWDDGYGKTPPLRCEFVEIDSRIFEAPPIVQHSDKWDAPIWMAGFFKIWMEKKKDL